MRARPALIKSAALPIRRNVTSPWSTLSTLVFGGQLSGPCICTGDFGGCSSCSPGSPSCSSDGVRTGV
eukprot:7378486-Prymnesium_polylepis.1